MREIGDMYWHLTSGDVTVDPLAGWTCLEAVGIFLKEPIQTRGPFKEIYFIFFLYVPDRLNI